MENFDLLQHRNKNNIFRVSFDFFTPRPQFVIIPKEIESINPEFSAITAEQTCVLIEAAKSVLSSFRIPSGVLSIHRGSWKSRPARSFHCHLCVNAERYLETFESQKKAIPNWPSVAYVTRQWCWNKDPHSYAQNVRGYPYKSRFKEDVSAIVQLMQASSSPESLGTNPTLDTACAQATDSNRDSTPWTQAQLGHCLSGIVYHQSHPKIGFVGKKDATVYDLHEILRAIERFAEAHGLTNTETEDKDYGCHVCLYLGPGMCGLHGQAVPKIGQCDGLWGPPAMQAKVCVVRYHFM